MSRVFVVQRQHKLVKSTGELVPKFDLRPAEQFGDLVFLLSPSTRPFKAIGVVDMLRARLSDYTSEDYLLLVGNPILIGLATAVAVAQGDGTVRLLQWSGSRRSYIPVEADLR